MPGPDAEGNAGVPGRDAGGPGRPATLEEVVLGHLAAGRVRSGTANRAPTGRRRHDGGGADDGEFDVRLAFRLHRFELVGFGVLIALLSHRGRWGSPGCWTRRGTARAVTRCARARTRGVRGDGPRGSTTCSPRWCRPVRGSAPGRAVPPRGGDGCPPRRPGAGARDRPARLVAGAVARPLVRGPAAAGPSWPSSRSRSSRVSRSTGSPRRRSRGRTRRSASRGSAPAASCSRPGWHSCSPSGSRSGASIARTLPALLLTAVIGWIAARGGFLRPRPLAGGGGGHGRRHQTARACPARCTSTSGFACPTGGS